MKKIKSAVYAFVKRVGLINPYLKTLFVLKRTFGIRQSNFLQLCAFYRPFIQKGETVFDIGANVGDRCEVFLALGADVLCIEPNKSLFEVLQVRFAWNRKVKILNAGCGESKSIKTFNIGSNHLTSTFSNKFIEHQKHLVNQEWTKRVDIQMTTVDHLIEQFGEPGFMKIDVEGYEKEVIMGLNKETGIISFEFHSPEFNENSVFCIQKLSRLGYKLFNISFGESLKMELDEWATVERMISFIRIDDRMKYASYGDFYVK
jgi:FkbM family methyltransferase